MRIIINDFIQESDADDELKSPDLSDRLDSASFTITLDSSQTFDSIGVGNTDATSITINGDVITLDSVQRDRNGLYLLSASQTTDTLVITHNGTYIGRFACGLHRLIGTSPQIEMGRRSTYQPRRTASGNVIEGAGGISYRVFSFDIRYKITSEIYSDYEAAYDTQIAKGFPFFLMFDKQEHRFPYERAYAQGPIDSIFETSINSFRYSIRLLFEEAF